VNSEDGIAMKIFCLGAAVFLISTLPTPIEHIVFEKSDIPGPFVGETGHVMS